MDNFERRVLDVALGVFEALASKVSLEARLDDDLAAEFVDKIQLRHQLEMEFNCLIADDMIVKESETLADVVRFVRECDGV